jgi:excisionase family DNA binding protein
MEQLPSKLLTAEQVAQILNVKRSKVFDLIRRQELFSVKIGGLRRIPVKAVDDFVEMLIGPDEAA